MSTAAANTNTNKKLDKTILRHLLALMLPLIASNILQQFYNAADVFVIGRYATEDAFAGIGIASSVMNLFLFAAIGACTGISVIFSQLYGAGEMARFRREHYLAAIPGTGAAIGISLLGILLLPAILHLIQVPGALLPYVRRYLILVLISLPASYLYNLYSAILRSVDHTKAVLLILAVTVTVNLVLDLFFVGQLRLGITGAAAATSLCQFLSAILSLLYLKKNLPELMFQKEDRRIDPSLVRVTLRLASVTAFHQSGLYIGKLIVQGIVNSAGTSIISAYTATSRIEGFANSFGDSGAAATSVITAQYFGAQRQDRIRDTFRCSFVSMLLLGIGCALVLFFTAGPASRLLLNVSAGEAYENAARYLRVISLFYLFCFTGNTFAGYYDGIGRVRIPLIGALSHMLLRILLSALTLHSYGLPALAAATGLGWIWVNLFWAWLLRRQRRQNGSS